MRPLDLQRISKLYLSTVFLAGAISAAAANSDMHLTGLALHQETGRSIYLGGIFFDQQAPKPEDLVSASGPKMMEYRVVARRTSIRSLLGGILLQSELANGQAPDEKVTRFANDILSKVQGSLYAGDSLEILLSENDHTIAYLNGQELARIDDGTVSDYFLIGWIGEQGPSTAFRDSINADEIDPALLQTFETYSFTAQRKAEVASWINPEQATNDTVASTTETETDTISATGSDTAMDTTVPPDQEELVEIQASAANATAAVTWEYNVQSADDIKGQGVMAASAATLNTSRAAANEPMIAQPKPRATPPHEPATTSALEEGTQVASLHPASGLLATSHSEGIETLDVKDYSQRLAQFNTNLIHSVYGDIQYPRQAVRRNIQGRLELDVTLQRDGTLLDVSVAQSSGYKILDKAAVKAAQKALASIDPKDLDPVAIAEYVGENNELVVPVPVQFVLTE